MSSISKQLWYSYFTGIVQRLELLLAQDRKMFSVDMHLHSQYSSDGIQTIEQIVDESVRQQFDVIAITDHDTTTGFDKILSVIDSRKPHDERFPIVIPGVEFSVKYGAYGDMCHIIKLFVDPNDASVQANIKHNLKALWVRASRQFEKIEQNRTLQYFFSKYRVRYSLSEFKSFLEEIHKKESPDYYTLVDYIYQKLKGHGVDLMDILERVAHYNQQDTCEERHIIKAEAIRLAEKRILENRIGSFKNRVLLLLLATKGIDDDDFPNHPPTGNLTITNFDQIDIRQLTRKGMTILAHPEADKLHLVDELKESIGLDGLEIHWYINRTNPGGIITKAREQNLFTVRGSDKHYLTQNTYEQMNFYRIERTDMKGLLRAGQAALEKLNIV